MDQQQLGVKWGLQNQQTWLPLLTSWGVGGAFQSPQVLHFIIGTMGLTYLNGVAWHEMTSCKKMLNTLPHSQQVLEKWWPLLSSATKAYVVTPKPCSDFPTSQIPEAEYSISRARVI